MPLSSVGDTNLSPQDNVTLGHYAFPFRSHGFLLFPRRLRPGSCYLFASGGQTLPCVKFTVCVDSTGELNVTDLFPLRERRASGLVSGGRVELRFPSHWFP